MANWFKLFECDLDETRMRYGMSKLPEVWPVWTALLMECCKHKSGIIPWESTEQQLFGFSERLKISIPKVNLAIQTLCEMEYCSIASGQLNVLKWNEKQDDYLHRKSQGYWDKRKASQCLTVNHGDSHIEERRGEESKGEYHKDTRSALYWLNENAGVKYREVDSNLKLISARLSEPEVTLSGVQQMIERQVALWRGTDMEKYIRPETLFNKTKFDSYYANRNSKIIERGDPRRVDRAKGTLNEGVSKQYDLRKVQAARAFQDAQRPGACPDV